MSHPELTSNTDDPGGIEDFLQRFEHSLPQYQTHTPIENEHTGDSYIQITYEKVHRRRLKDAIESIFVPEELSKAFLMAKNRYLQADNRLKNIADELEVYAREKKVLDHVRDALSYIFSTGKLATIALYAEQYAQQKRRSYDEADYERSKLFTIACIFAELSSADDPLYNTGCFFRDLQKETEY